jgi:diguanylate cyclase (GGDEF)-like protein
VQHQRLLRASRTEAATDALTRLGNRRRLMEDLEDALAHPDAGHTVLALFDLDGFKAYNDAFGHPAGDALLARIARALQDALGESGSAYRMGGDEFCALLPADHQGDGESRVRRLAAAMRQHGEGFDVTASSGLALLGADTDVSNALAEADRQLYAAKHSTRRTARDQTADALVAVTQARHPELRAHADHVRDVATAVARELAMPDHEVVDIREAARLHDIGKMAIPDGVLGKQGPLDGDEWKFMRRHTVIGERILTSAPALHGAARIVRSSHERWDGTGYPDGLAGSDIPLGARVIFACDAYDAMTSDRPYQAARESAVALAELRSCAGSQFDPEVVEALARVLATGAGAARVAA